MYLVVVALNCDKVGLYQFKLGTYFSVEQSGGVAPTVAQNWHLQLLTTVWVGGKKPLQCGIWKFPIDWHV